MNRYIRKEKTKTVMDNSEFKANAAGPMCKHGDKCKDIQSCARLHLIEGKVAPNSFGLCQYWAVLGKCANKGRCRFLHMDNSNIKKNDGWVYWMNYVYGRENPAETKSAAPATETASTAQIVKNSLTAQDGKKPPIAIPPPTEEEKKSVASLQAAKKKMEALMFPIKKQGAIDFIHENIDQATTSAQLILLLETAKGMLN